MPRIPERESLTVEFKSDRRKLNDTELVLAAVCLANTEGGTIWLGVEDNGEITGLHAEHRDISKLAALIANQTTPPLSVRVERIETEGHAIARIEVPRSERLVANNKGTLQRRRLLANGQPECVPFLPHEFATRESDLRLSDYSALPVAAASTDDIDPLERQRLRQAIERYGGDRSLVGLDDESFDGALGLTRSRDGERVPTVAGLLLAGRESALREHLPTHEVAFQRLLPDGSVQTNEFYRWPLIRLFEQLGAHFRANVQEEELQVGLFRVPAPSVEGGAFREAVVNAVAHRDYTRLGAVHIRWYEDELVISSPGGFIEGVTLENLLTVEPRPRNPLLADCLKRIGLAERTGRGVDLIYKGLLRYGRQAPDYSQSDATGVKLSLSAAPADRRFLQFVVEEENRRQSPLPVESLLVLSTIRELRRVQVSDITAVVQKPQAGARALLERLIEAGFVRASGQGGGRTYTLSPSVYRRLDDDIGYARQAGFERPQQEKKILTFVEQKGSVSRKDVVELCGVSPDQASRLLRSLAQRDELVRQGKGSATTYTRA